jgi:hypothetical protein
VITNGGGGGKKKKGRSTCIGQRFVPSSPAFHINYYKNYVIIEFYYAAM